MKVAIFGSFPEPGSDNGKGWELTGHSENFKAACRQIGHELAKRRCTLVVESENSKVADPHVVAGYVDAAETLASNTTASLRVEVAYSRGQYQPFTGTYNDHPGLVMYHQPIPAGQAGHQRWRNSHLVSLKHADAVLTIGGEQGTYLAGSAAMVAGKSLVPIASFGGASARLLSDLVNERNRAGNKDSTLLYGLNSPWSPHVLASAVSLLLEAHKAVFISHAHKDEQLARAVVRAIEAAFDLPPDAIRGTSVPGYTLPAGANVAGQLQQEIRTTEFVLGIVTPNSVDSKYVLFELGAAWGLGRPTFPLIACGVKHSDIPGPVSALRSLDLSSDKDCYQLLDDLGASPIMGQRRPANEADVADAIGRVVKLAGNDV